ncbi:uncharacterized protein LOC127764314 [Oryza glaberrima]|uniref:Uncharacterized protein n=1 Tax=Oryza glaberrima TaxID=4538 RepID=I1P0U1_ORYGL|nr:uncharacterized protein LOC127764314 [Oryza glaberrima]
MKRRDQEQAIAKLTSGGGGRDDLLIIFMWTKKAMLAAVVVVVAKCRELWEGVLTAGSGCGCVSRSAAAADDDDGYYFGRSYEFSCSATPVAFAPAKGRRRRRRCLLLPPCVGAKQAREMLREAAMISPAPPVGAGGCRRSPPERSPQWWREQEIDGLAEEFISRFYEQLRSQVADEERRRAPECKSRASSSPPSPSPP